MNKDLWIKKFPFIEQNTKLGFLLIFKGSKCILTFNNKEMFQLIFSFFFNAENSLSSNSLKLWKNDWLLLNLVSLSYKLRKPYKKNLIK